MESNKKMLGYGKRAKGRKELQKHVNGGKLTPKEAILADCYECMGGYTDGIYSCGIPACPLYSYMPYRDKKADE